MYNIIDGKKISSEILSELKNKVSMLKKDGKIITLVDIQVGDDDASNVYIENKKKKFLDIGINFRIDKFSNDIDEKNLIAHIEDLNADNNVNAIFVELPLPKHINETAIIDAIDYKKDVDGFNIKNVGALTTSSNGFYPCTASGIVELIKRSGIVIEGKHCVVIGRSNIVGKPVALLMLRENATVTICHSKTENIKDITKTADILIVATRNKKGVDESYIKEGTVVIDVGIHKENIDGKSVICGDVDFDKVSVHSSYITPVPGGVGPMTIAMLISNCIKTLDF